MADTAQGQIEISEIRKAEPVVVFESGLGSYKEIWNKVLPVIARTNTVFAYNRPGIGRSADTSRPRDAVTIVEELRALLRKRNLQPPYVLVGHSAGGLYMQLYARRYPSEAAGLVLVDPTHPTQFESEGALQNRSALSRSLLAVALTGSAKVELDSLVASGHQVLAAPSLPASLPIVILTAPDKSDTPIAAFDNAKRADFFRLYPSAVMREIDGGHDVPQENPQSVIQAIQEVLESNVRKSSFSRPMQ